MRIEPVELDDDWLDAKLMADDSSQAAWKRRAVGMSKGEALSRVPRQGQILVESEIGMMRQLKRRIRDSGQTQNVWVRQAIAMRLAAEGAGEDEVGKWMP